MKAVRAVLASFAEAAYDDDATDPADAATAFAISSFISICNE